MIIKNVTNRNGERIDITIEKSRITAVTPVEGTALQESLKIPAGGSLGESLKKETTSSGYEKKVDAAKACASGNTDPQNGALSLSSSDVLDAKGFVVLPSFVDTHTHLDKTTTGMDWYVNDNAPELSSWVVNERNRRTELGIDPYRQACRLIERDIAQGTIGIRSHVDIDLEHGLTLLDGVMQAREDYKDQVHIELVAFPQSGIVARPGTCELMRDAMRMGADLVGGIDPALMDHDPVAGVNAIFKLAEEADRPIDIHLHEPGHLGAFTMGLIIDRTKALSMEGRVTISHAFCLGYPEPGLAEPLIERLKDAQISITTDGQAYIKYVPSVMQLIQAGVLICGGNDNVRDMWSPYGSGDMLERAMLIAMRNGLRRDDLLLHVLDICTENGAKLLGLPDYGIAPGCDASFVLARAHCAAEAVAQVPRGADRIVFNHGKRLG